MREFSHARLACRSGANTLMGSVSYANDVGRWASNCWGEDSLGAPLDICRAACAVSKPQQIRGLTTQASSGYKTT